jgi:hypothetical protein
MDSPGATQKPSVTSWESRMNQSVNRVLREKVASLEQQNSLHETDLRKKARELELANARIRYLEDMLCREHRTKVFDTTGFGEPE